MTIESALIALIIALIPLVGQLALFMKIENDRKSADNQRQRMFDILNEQDRKTEEVKKALQENGNNHS